MKAAALLLCALLAALAGCTTTSTTTQRTPDASDAPASNPNDPSEVARRVRVRLELAGAYFAQGQTQTALDEVGQVLKLKPDSAEAWNLSGLIHARLGDDARAEDAFKRALQINPRDADTLHNYGWYQCQQRRYVEAQALFAQVLAQPATRDAPRTLLVQGVCEARAGRMDDAERTLTRAFEADPANVAVEVNLAEVLLRRGDLERARFHIRRVNKEPGQTTAQTLWLAARIEKAAGRQAQLDEFGAQLRNRFPKSREAAAFDQGRFDE